jgi:hypothetical protein
MKSNQITLPDNVKIFNEKFCNIYLNKVFEFKWFNMIEFILNVSHDKKFLCFYDSIWSPHVVLVDDLTLVKKSFYQNEMAVETKLLLSTSKAKEEIIEQLLVESESKLMNFRRANILKLICKSRKIELLRHPTTKSMLNEKWRYLPRFIYYMQLTIYLIYLLSYSIQIELYSDTVFN